MAMKPFEIQGADLKLGGVTLQAGTTGVVIPGVTQAANFRVEEVSDVNDQTYQFATNSEVVVVDAVLYTAIVSDGDVTLYADFTATTDDEGYIDEIQVNGRGTYNAMEADVASSVDMYAYVGLGSASDRPLVPEDWIQIPFRPKMRAGEVENIGSGGGNANTGNIVFTGDTIKGTSIGQQGTLFVIESDNGLNPIVAQNNSGGTFNGFDVAYNEDTLQIQAGWTVTTSNGNPDDSSLPFTFTVDSVAPNGNETITLRAEGTQFSSPASGTPIFPITIKSDDYEAGSSPVVEIQPDSTDSSVKFTFDGDRLYFPGGESSIYSTDNSDITVSTPGNITLNNSHGDWTFGSDGDLVLPAGKTIRDTSGADLLAAGGSGSTLLPPYKGFRAHYGSMYGNDSDPNGPINKLVIYKDTVTPASSISSDTDNDQFTVTGLTGSDIVAMLVVISDNISQTPVADLKTFVEAVIDNVILNNGEEGNFYNVDDMKIAFYNNFENFSSIISNVKTNFNFYDTNPLNYNVIDANAIINSSTSGGHGWNWYGLRYDLDQSKFVMSSGGTEGNGSFTVGDTLTILGTNLTDYQGNTLASPDNDVVITVTAVDGGGTPTDFTITANLPYITPGWPGNSIDDGGDDEYDTGNYIDTDLATGISYNYGNAVYADNSVGGGDYVVTYQSGIFGFFTRGASIDSIGTSGGSGFDGSGTAVTGGLYGGDTPADSPVISTWTNSNNNTWRIETYNGGESVNYNGDDNSAKWFDIANHSSGSNDFRGAIIQYHAFIQNRGTIIGTIHLSNDYSQQNATHTEHLSGGSDLQYVTLWDCNYNHGQLYFKMTNGQNWDAMIQWTSTVFYGQEYND